MVPVGPFLPFGRGGGIVPGRGVMEQGAGGQVLGMAGQVVLPRVSGRADGQGGLVHELARGQAADVAFGIVKGHIHRGIPVEIDGGVAGAHMQLHGRIALLEIVELGDEPGQGQTGGGIDGQGAEVVLQQLGDLFVDLLEGVEVDVAQAFAFRRQGNGTGQAVEQGKAQFLFQTGDAVADSAGGQAQVPGRGLEAHVAGRDGEGLDVDEAGVIVEDAGDAAGTLTVFAVGKRHIVSLEIPARKGRGMRTDICRKEDIPFFTGFRQYGQACPTRRPPGRAAVPAKRGAGPEFLKIYCYFNMLY